MPSKVFSTPQAKRLTLKMRNRLKKQLAICYTNRTAAYLMDGAASDPGKAHPDGKAAEEVDATYLKVQACNTSIIWQLLHGRLDTFGKELLIKYWKT